MLTTTNATQRKKSTMKCGIASSHLTSQSPRLSCGESSPMSWSGYGDALASMLQSSLSPESDDGYGRGFGHVLVQLGLGDAENGSEPLRHPPVGVTEELHQRRHEQGADDGGVEDDPGREADRERLDLVAGCRRENEEG